MKEGAMGVTCGKLGATRGTVWPVLRGLTVSINEANSFPQIVEVFSTVEKNKSLCGTTRVDDIQKPEHNGNTADF